MNKYEFFKTAGGMFWLYHGGREEEHVIEVARIKTDNDIRKILSEYIDDPIWLKQDNVSFGEWFRAFPRNLTIAKSEKILTIKQIGEKLEELEGIWKDI